MIFLLHEKTHRFHKVEKFRFYTYLGCVCVGVIIGRKRMKSTGKTSDNYIHFQLKFHKICGSAMWNPLGGFHIEMIYTPPDIDLYPQAPSSQ